MGLSRKKRGKVAPEMNVTPLVDVVLVPVLTMMIVVVGSVVQRSYAFQKATLLAIVTATTIARITPTRSAVSGTIAWNGSKTITAAATPMATIVLPAINAKSVPVMFTAPYSTACTATTWCVAATSASNASVTATAERMNFATTPRSARRLSKIWMYWLNVLRR